MAFAFLTSPTSDFRLTDRRLFGNAAAFMADFHSVMVQCAVEHKEALQQEITSSVWG
jgi:hypothetical protein